MPWPPTLLLPVLVALPPGLHACGQEPHGVVPLPRYPQPGHFPATSLAKEDPLDRGVLAALDWLLRHRAPAGHWDASGFTHACEGHRCPHPAAGKGSLASTALAAQVLSRAGNTLRMGEHKHHYKKAIAYLYREEVGGQGGTLPQGCSRVDGALATVALAEAFFRARYRILHQPVLVLSQGLEPSAKRPMTAWEFLVVDTLKENGGLLRGWTTVPPGWKKGADRWLAGSPPNPEKPVKNPGFTLDATALGLARAWGRRRWSGTTIDKQSFYRLNLQMRLIENPKHPVEPWTLYFGTRLLAPAPAKTWKAWRRELATQRGATWDLWRKKVATRLLQTQAVKGCPRGSWAPTSAWGKAGGRVQATALRALILLHCRERQVAIGPRHPVRRTQPPPPYSLDVCVYRHHGGPKPVRWLVNGAVYYDTIKLGRALAALHKRFAASPKGVPPVTIRINRNTTQADIAALRKLIQAKGYTRVMVDPSKR